MKSATRTVMVRYTTAPPHVQTNADLVRHVFEELHRLAPGGLRYTCYQVPREGTFVHVATLDTTDENPLTTLASFKAFQRELKSRCVEPPVVTELATVGSYGQGS